MPSHTIAWLIIFLSVCFGCSEPQNNPKHVPEAIDGAISLTDWSFVEHGVMALDGSWDFCWNELLEPPDQDCASGWSTLTVPGLWSQLGHPRQGVGTYRLHVSLDTIRPPLTLRVFGPYSAHRLWINGREYAGAGVVEADAANAVYVRRNFMHALPADANELHLLVQVANDPNRSGGLRQSWFVGTQHDIQNQETARTVSATIFMSVYTLLGTLFLILYALNRRNRTWLYFALIGISAGLRFLPATSFSDLGQIFLPDLPLDLAVRLEYAANNFIIYFAMSYFAAKLGRFIPRPLTRSVQVSALVCAAIAAFAPMSLVHLQLNVTQSLAIFHLVVAMVAHVIAYLRGVPHLRLTLVATAVCVVAITHDILRIYGIWVDRSSIEWLPVSLTLFMLAESLVLLRTFYDSFNTIESLSKDLLKRNEDLQETNRAVERFVPMEFLKQLNKGSIREIQRGDHCDVNMNIMFADIRSFTRQIEQKNSQQAFEYINAFLERMEIHIHRQGGFINQYLGDAIMALFSGPSDLALTAAIEMQRSLTAHNEARRTLDRFETRIGIGLNFGPLILGAIGGQSRLDSGVVGDAANVAAHIEALTKVYDTRILISQSVYDGLSDVSRYELRELDRIQFKGREQAVTVYEVLDVLESEDRLARIAMAKTFQEGLRLFRLGRTDDARAMFADCVARCPEDAPARIYLERCSQPAMAAS